MDPNAAHNETFANGAPVADPIYGSNSIGAAINGSHRFQQPGLHNQGEMNQPVRMDYRPTGARTDGQHEPTADEAVATVFVGGLHPYIDDRMLVENLSCFGNVMSITRKYSKEGGGQGHGKNQYAFVRFEQPFQAENALREGVIEIDGRTLSIRHRHEKPHRPNRPNVYGHPNRNLHGPVQHVEQTFDAAFNAHQNDFSEEHMRRFNNPQRVVGQSPQHKQVDVSRNNRRSHAGPAPVLMDRDLVVANLPSDMSPKEFFELFSEVGQVEGCFIFPEPDRHGRRFGHISMVTFFLAQKAVEAFNRYLIRNCQLEVGYKGNNTFTPAPSNLVGDGMMGPVYQRAMQHHEMQRQAIHQHAVHQQAMHHQEMQRQAMQRQAIHQQTIHHPPVIHHHEALHNQQAMHPYELQQMPMNGMQHLPIQNWPSPPHPHLAPPQFEHGSPPGIQGPFNVPPPGHHPPLRNMPGPFFSPMMAQGFPPVYNVPPTSPPDLHLQPLNSNHSMVGNEAITEPQNFQNVHLPYNAPNEVSHQQNLSPVARCVSNDSQNSSATLVSSQPAHNRSKEVYSGMPPIEASDHRSTPSPVILKNDPSQSIFQIIPTPIIPDAKKPSDPCNLFAKNLDDMVVSTSDDLKSLFEQFGTTTSVSLATFSGSNISRGYGFVAFAEAESAKKALNEVNNSLIGRKRVFVSYAERKEDRQKRLNCIFNGTPLEEDEEGKVKEEEVQSANQSETPSTTENSSSNQQKPESEVTNQDLHQSEGSFTASDASVDGSATASVKETEVVSCAPTEDGSSETTSEDLSASAKVEDESSQVLMAVDEAVSRSLSLDENKPSVMKPESPPLVGLSVNKTSLKGLRTIVTLPSVAEADEDDRQTSSSGSEKSFDSAILAEGGETANRGPIVKGRVAPAVPDQIFRSMKLRKGKLTSQSTSKQELSPAIAETAAQDFTKTRAVHSDSLVPASKIPTQTKNAGNVSKNRPSNAMPNNSTTQTRTQGGSKKWRSNSNSARNHRGGAKNNGSGQLRKEQSGTNTVEQTAKKGVSGTVPITVTAH